MKRSAKAFSVTLALLAIAICLASVPLTDGEDAVAQTSDTSEVFAYGSGTEEDPFTIENLEQLEAFRDSVNEGNDYARQFIQLTKDAFIELKPGWIPIGNSARTNTVTDDTRVFSGTFDGNGGMISKLDSTGYKPGQESLDGNEFVYGLFGFLNNATVKNLWLDGVNINIDRIQTESGELLGDTVGALAGFALGNVKIDNVSVRGEVTGYNAVAGVVARSYGTSIEITECTNYADITATDAKEGKAGGISAIISSQNTGSTITNSANQGLEIDGVIDQSVISAIHSGGILGYSGDGTVTILDCYVGNSTVTSPTPGPEVEATYAGGIVGKGNLTTITSPDVISVDVSTTWYSGGVLGGTGSSSAEIVIDSDFFLENLTVTSENRAGGIVGYLLAKSAIIDGTNGGQIDSTSISVTSDTGDNFVGGVIGAFTEGTYKGELTIRNVSIWDMTLDVANYDVVDGESYYGDVRGTAIGYVASSSTVTVDNVSDKSEYEIIAQTSVNGTVVLKNCNTLHPISWAKTGSVTTLKLENAWIEEFARDFGYITIDSDENSRIARLVAGGDDYLTRAQEMGWSIDHVEAAVEFRIAEGTTLNVDTVYLHPDTTLEGATYAYRGLVTGADMSMIVIVADGDNENYMKSGTYRWDVEDETWDSPCIDMRGTGFFTLQEAVDSDHNVDIKLLEDIVITSGVNISEEKQVYIDLNGHTISLDAGFASSYVFDNSGMLVIQVSMIDDHIIEGGTIDASAVPGVSIFGNNGILNIYAGIFETSGDGAIVSNLTENTFISDGTFTSENTIIDVTSGTVTISGGTFSAGTDDPFSVSGGKVSVSGGNFDKTLSENYLQTGYVQNNGTVEFAGTGTTPVASIGGTYYDDFYEALEVAQNGLSLYLEQDFTIEQPVTIDGIVSIHTFGHKLTFAENGSITVTGNLDLLGGSDPSLTDYVVITGNDQLVVQEGGVLYLSGIIIYDPAGDISGDPVMVKLYGGSIQGTTSDYYTHVVIGNGAYLKSTVEATTAVYIGCIDGQYAYGTDVNVEGALGENVTIPVALDSGLTSTEGNIPNIGFLDGWRAVDDVHLAITTDGYARWFFQEGDYTNFERLEITQGEISIRGGTWPSGKGYEQYVYETLIIVDGGDTFTVQNGVLITFTGYGLDGVQVKIPWGQSFADSGAQLPEVLNGVDGVYSYNLYYYNEPWDRSTVFDSNRVEIEAEREYVATISMDPEQPFEGQTVDLTVDFPVDEGFVKVYDWYIIGSDGVLESIGSDEVKTVTEPGTYVCDVEVFPPEDRRAGVAHAEIKVTFGEPPIYDVTIHYPEYLGWEDDVVSVVYGQCVDPSQIDLPEGYTFSIDNGHLWEIEIVSEDITLEPKIALDAPEVSSVIVDSTLGYVTISLTVTHVLDGVSFQYGAIDTETEEFIVGEDNDIVIRSSGTYVATVYAELVAHPEVFTEWFSNPMTILIAEAPGEGEGYSITYGSDLATVTADTGYNLIFGSYTGDTIQVGPGQSFQVQVAAFEGTSASAPTTVQMAERPQTPENADIVVSYRDISVSTQDIEIRIGDGEWGATITELTPGTEYTVEYRLVSDGTTFAGDTKTVTVTTTALDVPAAPSEGQGFTATIGEETAQVTPAEGYEIALETDAPGTEVITVGPDQAFYVRVAATDTQTASEWTENVITKPAAPGDIAYSVSTNSIVAGPGLEMKFLQNGTWTEKWVDEITGLSPDMVYTVKFRLAATDSTFASNDVERTVWTEAKPEQGLEASDAPAVGTGFTTIYTADEVTITSEKGFQLSYDGETTSMTALILGPEKTFYVRVAATEAANASEWTPNTTSGRPVTTEEVTIEVTPTTIVVSTTGIEFRVDGGDWTTAAVTGLSPETAYQVEYRFASDGTSFAGTVNSVERTTPPLYVPEAPPQGYGYTAVFDDDTATITPSAMFEISSDGENVAESLTLGPGGSFKVRVAASGEYTYSAWTDVTLPDRPQAPNNPNITAGRTSVSVSDAGIEIRIGDGEWASSVTGLSSGTSYTVQYRVASTETSFAGVVGEVTVRTTSSSGGDGGGTTPTPDPEPEPDEDTETVTNPDGSSTTTTTRPDGSSTVTTERPDGSSTTTDTKPVEGGTQTTVTDTDSEGNTTSTTTTETETTTSTGSTVSSTTVERTDAEGNTTSTTESTYTSEDESTVTRVTVSTDAEGNTTAQTSTTVTVTPSEEGTATVTTDAIAEAVSQIEHATADADETSKVITVQPDGDTAQNMQVVMEPEAMQHIADSGADLEITGDVGTIRASPEVATSLSERTSAVTMSISLADKNQMAPVIQNIVGDRPTYQLTASSGEDSIHELGGDVTVTIPYTLSEGEDPESIVVFYVDDDGILHAMPTTYEDGVVSFTTDHFSYYTIQSEIAAPEPEPSDDGGDDNTVFYIAAAIIAIVVIAAIVMAVRHKA